MGRSAEKDAGGSGVEWARCGSIARPARKISASFAVEWRKAELISLDTGGVLRVGEQGHLGASVALQLGGGENIRGRASLNRHYRNLLNAARPFGPAMMEGATRLYLESVRQRIFSG